MQEGEGWPRLSISIASPQGHQWLCGRRIWPNLVNGRPCFAARGIALGGEQKDLNEGIERVVPV